jgi:hypothetical protein
LQSRWLAISIGFQAFRESDISITKLLSLAGGRLIGNRVLADVLAAHPHVLVMTNDIVERLRYDGQSTPHFLQAAQELRDRTLAINGVSKIYAMTGWRIGYVAGPQDLVVVLDTLLDKKTKKRVVVTTRFLFSPAKWMRLKRCRHAAVDIKNVAIDEVRGRTREEYCRAHQVFDVAPAPGRRAPD